MGRATQRVLFVVFFLSGAAALLFETLWFRLAGITFGNSVWASALVLASFMAGLASGSLLVARFGHRLRCPLRAYAALEIIIGVTGFSLIFLFPFMTPVLAGVYQKVLGNAWALNAVRLAVAFVMLWVPATAMGATLPLLARALSRSGRDFGQVLGRLYGWNTFGAVVGALSGELVFIGAFGIQGTGLVAAGVNAVAAVAAMALLVAGGGELESTPRGRTRAAALLGSSTASRLLVASFLAGATLLGFEVVWFRFMLLFHNSTSLVFALLLSVVLGGIAMGGFLASWWLRVNPSAYRFLPFLALGGSIIIYGTYARLDEWMGLLSALPISTMSGVLFTFTGRALKDEIEDETIAAASLTFANTLGAMTGSLVSGFLVLPFLGVETGFFVLAVGYTIVALFALDVRTLSPVETRWLRGLAAVTAVLLALFPFGLMQNHFLPKVLAPFTTDGSVLVRSQEGVTETAFYLRKDFFGDARHHRLVTNGFSMSSTNFRSRRYMSLFAY